MHRRPGGSSIRDRIRMMMQRRGAMRGGSPASHNFNMQARNNRMNSGPMNRPTMNRPSPSPNRPGSSAGGPVPGLPGVRFGADFANNMRTAARSSAQFHSGNLQSMANHPAVNFSRTQAGLNGGGVTDFLKQATMDRLAAKGITHDASGYNIAGVTRPRDPAAIYNPTGAKVPSPGLGGVPQLGKVPSPGLGGVPQLGRTPSPGLGSVPTLGQPSANANGGNISLGNIPANTQLNVDVSGGTEIANGRTTTGTPGQATVNGQSLGGPSISGASLADSIRQSMNIPKSPMVSGSSLADTIRTAVNAQLAGNQIRPTPPTTGTLPAPSPGLGGTTPGTQYPAAPSSAPPLTGGPAGMDMAAQQIITQETGGQDLTGQTNCTIRPGSGCLALNSGIFESTANEMGMDFNRIVNDPAYAAQAVNTLLSGYAADDASKWGGPAGMSVWDYGNQNLPGGGMEAVARVYFGGDVTGQYVDEQGRSGATYGQQFMEKMYNAGYDPATAAQPTAGTQQPMPPGAVSDYPNRPAVPMPTPTGPYDKVLTGPGGMTQGVFAPATQGQPPPYDAGINPNAPEITIPSQRPYNAGINPNAPSPILLPNQSSQTYTDPNQYGPTGQPLVNTMDYQAQGIAAPGANTGMGDPQGIVQSPLVSPNAQGMDWSVVNQWDDAINAAVAQYPEVDPAMVKSAIAMESLGNPNAVNGPASGIMQIQRYYHDASAAAMGLDLSKPEDQIMYWTALMAGKVPGQQVAGNTPIERYANNYGTGDAYFQDINSLMNEIHGAAPPSPQQPAPATGPAPINANTAQYPQGLAPPPTTGAINGQAPVAGGPLHNTSVPQSIPPALMGGPLHDTSVPQSIPPALLGNGVQPTAGNPQTGGMPLGSMGLPVIQGPQQLPGSAVSGQAPPLAEQRGGMLVGADAVGALPSINAPQQLPPPIPPTTGTFDPNVAFPGSSGQIITPGTGMNRPMDTSQITPGVTPGTSPANITPANPGGLATTTSGESPISPVNPQPKIPQPTGVLEIVGNSDGMGIAATTASDDSWQKTAFGPETTTSTYYKQPVTWSCTSCGGGCLYNYQCSEAGNGYYGADASTHAAMDILCNGGAGEDCRNSPVRTPVAGTVLCSGGQGEGNYLGCNFATSPGVVDNGGVGQISVNAGTDVNGNMLVMEYWHMQTSNVQPGQQLQPGDLLGGMGSMGGMVHTHLEAQGWCPECNGGQGAMVTLDPTLVANGYYSTHSPSEGYASPAKLGPVQTTQPQGYMSGQSYQNLQSAPAPAYTPDPSSGYAPSDPGYYQSQAAAPASGNSYQPLPDPSYYAGSATPTTGQTYFDDETGRQYEIMADGSARLIYDPAWG